MSVISYKTSHVRKTKLHVSLDRVLRGNKYHVFRCRVPPWRPPTGSTQRVVALRVSIVNKISHVVECLVSILIFRIIAM